MPLALQPEDARKCPFMQMRPHYSGPMAEGWGGGRGAAVGGPVMSLCRAEIWIGAASCGEEVGERKTKILPITQLFGGEALQT